MRRWAVFFALILIHAIAAATSNESYLKIGDAAPALHPMAWIKGEPIARYEPGRTYVVEFWATWCPPCIETVPHLTDLQSKYRDQLTVVGVNVLEAAMGEGDESSVRAFVAKGRPQMGYTVAMDHPIKQPVFNEWMISAGMCCLPAAFIVDGRGSIVWMGNTLPSVSYPFDEALNDTLAGKPDLVRARAIQESTRAEAAKVLVLKPALDARMQRDFPAEIREVDRLLAQHPEYAFEAFPLKLAAMLHVKEQDALAYVQSTAKLRDLRARLNAVDDPTYWGLVGRTIVYETGLSKSAYERAIQHLQTATHAPDGKPASSSVSGPRSAYTPPRADQIADWAALAEAQYKLGHRDQALEAQKSALSLADKTDGVPPVVLANLKSALSEYQGGIDKH
jgi:thiol-disulfide isomerase/thioredoxin